jgi:N-methylhydantoinase B
MKRVALVCTRGFADVMTLARQRRPDPYALHVGESPWLALLPAAMRVEISGRIGPDGEEVAPLGSLDALVSQLKALPEPPQTIAVSLIFAHRNPVHEKSVRDALARALPGVPVHCSHECAGDAHAGEYERTAAALAAAGLEATAARAAAVLQEGLAGELEQVSDRMQAVLVERAVSSVVREAMDCAAALFLPDGRMLAQARSLPLLLGSLSPAVEGLLAAFPAHAMKEGDGFLSNDPWSGGTHLPDFVLLRPVIIGSRVRALAACILHHQDIGGITPGSVPTDATSVQQEGLRIPPVQLYRGGVADESLMRLLRANSRMPDNLAGDLAAQWAALANGCSAMQGLLEEQGDGFEQAAAGLLEASAAAARRALADAPDGDYRYSDALDGDGITAGLVPVEVVLRKRGDAVTIDLSGCAPQARGPVNASRGAVWAAVTYFARMLAPTAPSNGGCTQPIRLVTVPGTVVDPLFPAAVNARTNLVKLLANAFMGAWAHAVPHASPAANAGVAVVLSLGGRRADGGRWLFTEIIASAAGGAPWGAGGSGVSTDVGNARNTPAEAIESQAPLRVERIALHAGSGGAGLHAGGCGITRAYRLLEGEGSISYRGERHGTQAQGAAGGMAGACGSARLERADGTVEQLPAKARAAWRAGDLLVVETAGGGGWGKPVPRGVEIA